MNEGEIVNFDRNFNWKFEFFRKKCIFEGFRLKVT